MSDIRDGAIERLAAFIVGLGVRDGREADRSVADLVRVGESSVDDADRRRAMDALAEFGLVAIDDTTVTDARNARSRLTKRGCECEPDAGRCKRCLDVDDADSELADAVLEQLGADR